MPTATDLKKQYDATYPNAPKDHQTYLKTAQYIGEYLEEQGSQDKVKEGLTTHGLAFLDNQDKTSESTLLFAELSLQAYLENIPDTEQGKEHLHRIKLCLHALYNTPTQDTAKNLDALLENTEQWLSKLETDTIADAKRTSKLCTSLYTALTIMVEKLKKNNTMTIRTTLYTLGIELNFKEKIKQISTLLSHVDARASSLSPSPVVPHHEDDALEDDPFEAGLQHLETILAIRKQHPDIKRSLNAAQTLLDALDSNEQNVTNKDYALTLIRDNQTAFNTLLEDAPEAEQQAWRERIDALEGASTVQYATNTMLYALSWVAAPTNALYRTITPQETQDFVTQHTLATPDSEAKNQLRALAQARITNLTSVQDELNTSAKQFEATKAPTQEDSLEKTPILEYPLQDLEALYRDGCKAKSFQKEAKEMANLNTPSPQKQQKKTMKAKIAAYMRNFLFKTYENRGKILRLFRGLIAGTGTSNAALFKHYKKKFRTTRIKDSPSTQTPKEQPIPPHKPPRQP